MVQVSGTINYFECFLGSEFHHWLAIMVLTILFPAVHMPGPLSSEWPKVRVKGRIPGQVSSHPWSWHGESREPQPNKHLTWAELVTGHWSPHRVSGGKEVTIVCCTPGLTALDANWITRLWFYNFHFYLSPRAKRLRIPQSCELNVKWNQNHSSDSWNVFRVLQRNISMHAIIGFALVYILYIFT